MKPIKATSAVEFLIWLFIAASAIAMLAKRLRAPCAVALVAVGLMLGALRLPRLSLLDPGQRPDWLTPDVILIVFLPALVFEGGVKRRPGICFCSRPPNRWQYEQQRRALSRPAHVVCHQWWHQLCGSHSVIP